MELSGQAQPCGPTTGKDVSASWGALHEGVPAYSLVTPIAASMRPWWKRGTLWRDEGLRVSARRRKRQRLVAAQGFDPVYGARPLRRFIAHEVETRIGRALLAGDVHDGATLRVDARDGELIVDDDNPPQRREAAA